MWSEQPAGAHEVGAGHPGHGRQGANSSAAAVLAYDVSHKAPWDWRVSMYTITKGISAGVYLAALLLTLLAGGGWEAGAWLRAVPMAALVALGITGALLIWDLEHPKRFYMIFTRPHWKSWLVRGAFAIAAYSLVLVAHLGAGLGGGTSGAAATRWIAWAGAPIAVMTAVYTAYLFAQSKARDLWQNPLLPPHFLIQSVFAGAATLLLMEAAGFGTFPGTGLLLALTGATHLLLLLGEFTLTHSTAHARLAAHEMLSGRYAVWFWAGALGVAVASGLAAFAPASLTWAAASAGGIGLVGLYAHEHAHVQAAQSVPLA